MKANEKNTFNFSFVLFYDMYSDYVREIRNLEFKQEITNSSYEELVSEKQDLSFEVLNRILRERIGIDTFSVDTLKTLELYDNQKGYNIAGQLLSDKNDYPGIDVARFGESINVILDRETFL